MEREGEEKKRREGEGKDSTKMGMKDGKGSGGEKIGGKKVGGEER